MLPTTQTPRVFVSYSRRDGEVLARELCTRLTAQGIPLWRDRDALEGGRDWWLQITAALDQVEFLVLVMTEAALESELVRREWRYARQRGVCVYPVLGSAALRLDRLPRWMRSVHFYDLEHQWTKFVNDLNTRPTLQRVPFMVEDLPPDHVPRSDVLTRAVPLLIHRDSGEPQAVTVALHGAGGFGKTALARAVCHDEAIQSAFDDGILWVTIGEQPGDLIGRLEDLIFVLRGQRPGFVSLEAAIATFVELLAEREMLIVIDDVWGGRHAHPFMQGGPRCARLITTRNIDTLPVGALRVAVDAMQRSDALSLLGYQLPAGHDTALALLAERLGEWPLLLKLVNGALRERVQAGQQPLLDALAYVNKALDKRGLTFFDARDAASRHRAVEQTLKLSLAQLEAGERTRLEELAVFPEDERIDLRTLARWWGHTGGLDDFDVEALCDRLHRLSLLLSFDPAALTIRLHDVIRQYLLDQLGDSAAGLHARFLEALRPRSGSWCALAPQDGYAWDHLIEHLLAAGRRDELRLTLVDLRYLAAKTHWRHAYAVEADLRLAAAAGLDDAELAGLRDMLAQCQHLLQRCATVESVHATLYSRLMHRADVQAVLDSAVARLPSPRIEAAQALPDLPHPALIRTISQPRCQWLACAFSPDGRWVAGAGSDTRIRIWNAQNGVEHRLLSGHTSAVRGLSFTPDGQTLVSAGYDRRLRVWDWQAGRQIAELRGHTDGVTACAVLPDGLRVVSCSRDESVRLWDLSSASLQLTLARDWREQHGRIVNVGDQGHWASVWDCAVSADGRRMASASSDETLIVWDANSGQQLRLLPGLGAAATACAFSPDGHWLASGGANGLVLLWNLVDDVPPVPLAGHQHEVKSCSYTPDGQRLVSSCADGELIIWHLATRSAQQRYSGHTAAVNDAAVSQDGRMLVTASSDGSVRLWRLDAGLVAVPKGQPAELLACARIADTGRYVTAGADGVLRIQFEPTGAGEQQITAHVGEARTCAVSPDGRLMASGGSDGALCVWDVATAQRVARWAGSRDWVGACAFHPGGGLVAAASNDRSIRLWDLNSRSRRLAFLADRDSVCAFAFDPQGRHMVSGSVEGALRRWTLTEDEALWESWLTDSSPMDMDRACETFDARELLGHKRAVNQLVYAPDGAFLLSASGDGTIGVWDPQRCEPLALLSGHGGGVAGCAVDPQGRWIASVADDGGLRIWRVGDWRCVAGLQVDGALAQCLWLADGHLLAVGTFGTYHLRWCP